MESIQLQKKTLISESDRKCRAVKNQVFHGKWIFLQTAKIQELQALLPSPLPVNCDAICSHGLLWFWSTRTSCIAGRGIIYLPYNNHMWPITWRAISENKIILDELQGLLGVFDFSDKIKMLLVFCFSFSWKDLDLHQSFNDNKVVLNLKNNPCLPWMTKKKQDFWKQWFEMHLSVSRDKLR